MNEYEMNTFHFVPCVARAGVIRRGRRGEYRNAGNEGCAK